MGAVSSRVEAVGGAERRVEGTAVVVLALAIVIWGTTPRVTAEGAPYAPALTITMLRAFPTALVLLLALPVLRYALPRTREAWRLAAVTGILMVTIFLTTFTEAIVRAGPGIALVLMSTSPFFILALQRTLRGQPIAQRTLGGILVGFAGVVLVVSTQLGEGGGDTALGVGFALLCAAAWALGTFLVGEGLAARPQTDLTGLTAGQYLIGGTLLVPIALLVDGTAATDWGAPELWLVTAYISVIGSAIATVLYFASLRRMDPATVTSWLFLCPVVGLLLELVLGNAPGTLELAGMVLTIAGVAIVSARSATAA
jgi:probable blue pigment (indigoidine) exporter